ncbi:MAG: glycoside hydrolase family 2 TIM barrel-domain containing protein [bacterium]
MIKKLSIFLLIVGISVRGGAEEKKSFQFAVPGVNGAVNYAKYGQFEGIGTSKYKYHITDRHGLLLVSGTGVYPNWTSALKDPAYRKLKAQNRLDGNHWSHVDTADPLADFFVWVTAHEEYGVKQFFTAQALEESGLFMQAVKAYYAVVVFFPQTPCWGADRSFVWYIGPEAIQRIQKILTKHPELGLTLTDADITIKNGSDINLSNDEVIVNPGMFKRTEYTGSAASLSGRKASKITNRRGTGAVHLLQYDNGHWQLVVDNTSFMVQGVHYAPTPVGMGPTQTHEWMFKDCNENGKIDAPYESWVDINKNNKKDTHEQNIGDFSLLNAMGCNAVRLYHSSSAETYDNKEFNKMLLRTLFEKYGVRIIMGDFVGAYTIGSGADWDEGTDYTDLKQRKKMMKSVKDMVLDHKDEPYLLMWVLGNENNMPADFSGVNATRTNASSEPEAYAEFINEIAGMIHKLDPNHPVALGNLETDLIEYYARYSDEIDILAVNSYRGKRGFGGLWLDIKKIFDRPVLILEYGCDAYDNEKGIDEEAQKKYHKGCWEDIESNSFNQTGAGNAIGGIVFEWIDEWWKDNISGDQYDKHQTIAQSQMPFPDGWSHEEWLGIVGQGDGSNSPFLRNLRKTYYYYKEAWKKGN